MVGLFPVSYTQPAAPSTGPRPASVSSSSGEGGVSKGSTDYHAKFAVPHSSSNGEASSLESERFMELKRQLSVSLAAQTERDQRIAQLTGELGLKSALLEQVKATAAEGQKRARLELSEQQDRSLAHTRSLVKQMKAELVEMQSKLRNTEAKLDESLLSRDQQVRQYRAELENAHAELEKKKFELEALRKEKAGTLHTVTVASLVDLDEDQSMYGLKEDDFVLLQTPM